MDKGFDPIVQLLQGQLLALLRVENSRVFGNDEVVCILKYHQSFIGGLEGSLIWLERDIWVPWQ